MEIKFTVQGTPQPKQRPRVTSRGTYTPARTKDYEKIVGWSYAAAGGKMMSGAIEVRVNAYFCIPKSRKDVSVGDWHLQRPDLDNVVKIVKDALNGIAYKDDSQVVVEYGNKMWGASERIEVTVKEIANGR